MASDAHVRAAHRMDDIEFSGIRKVFEQARRLEKSGKKIISLAVGHPDFDTPVHIKDAAKAALDRGFTAYTSNYGTDELREAISDRVSKVNGIDASPSNVIVTVGANEAVFMALAAMVDPGDEVILPDPAWPHYCYCVQMLGARPVFLPLREGNGFMPDPAELEGLVTSRTRMVVLNTPHNPTGSVLDLDNLKALAAVADRHGLVVLSDEIYEQLVYDDARHHSMASLSGMGSRVITVGGFSKAYAMTGWRLGYVVADKAYIDAMVRVHQYTVTCATSFVQSGGVAALTGPQDCVADMRSEFNRRRLLVVDTVASMETLSCARPLGAFYAFINVKQTGMTCQEACEFFLSGAGVALVPGSVFGEFGVGYLRLAYSNSYENIRLALELMNAALIKRQMCE